MGRNRNSPHPLLRGGRQPYPHGFSLAEMQSLAVICDTLIPSHLAHPFVNGNGSTSNPNANGTISKSLEEFYRMQGSENGTPDRMAGLIARRCTTMGTILVRFVLWSLQTRPGTFLLCGRANINWKKLLNVKNFASIPPATREKILMDWSLGSGSAFDSLFQNIFKTLKTYCMLSFYSAADASGRNPCWTAIGYFPPVERPPIDGRRPLENGILNVSAASGEELRAFLGRGGFELEEGVDISASDKSRRRRPGREGKFLQVKCDVVVVGSGSGGGVAAGALARSGYKVLVLEKGKYFARDDLSLLEGPSLDQMYEGGGIICSADTNITMLAASTVGGGSAINWSASIRTPPSVIGEWANDHGLRMFESREYADAVEEVCERAGVAKFSGKESFQNSVLRRGCAELGYDVEDVYVNNRPGHSCGMACCFGCRNGEKQGTGETWLADAVNSRNAQILAGCEAKEVVCIPAVDGGSGLIRTKRALGVLAMAGADSDKEKNDKYYIFVRAKATVIACGSLLTPRLLRASGLRNPEIGRNLHLHPVQMAWGYFPPGVGPEGESYQGDIITVMCKEGPGSGYVIQTPALAPGSFAALMPWISGADMKQRMARYPRTAHLFVLCRDRGSGATSRAGGVEYAVNASDRENLEHGLQRALRILIAAGATEVGTHRNDGEVLKIPGEGSGGDRAEEFLQKASVMEGSWCPMLSAHQMGSCRMGVDPATSCVDENGESWEVGGLFVSDASVFPSALGVNPMITVQSIALCISRRVERFLQ